MAEATYTVHADPLKNRLYLSFIGFFSDPLMKEACTKIEQEVLRLKPGFSVITDISQAKPATQAGNQLIERTQRFIADHGVGNVVRITSPRSVIIQHQFKRPSEGLYASRTASSLEEAERMLDEEK